MLGIRSGSDFLTFFSGFKIFAYILREEREGETEMGREREREREKTVLEMVLR